MPDPHRPNTWKLDKHVPIAVIFTLVLQTGLAIWWTAKLESRVEVLELYVTTRSADGDRLIRIEEQLKYIVGALSDMKPAKPR